MSKKRGFTTKTLVYCAFLTAIGVVLARLMSIVPTEVSRFSIEAVPTVLAGLFFGPIAGALTGFAADFIGCLFSPYGFNPIFSLPPILYGLTAGFFRPMVEKKSNFLTLLLTILPAALFGSVLWQSFALAFVYSGREVLLESFLAHLTTRSVQFAVTAVLDAMILSLLFRAKIFTRLGLWGKTMEETLSFIHSTSWKGSVPGLSRTEELLEKIGNPELELKFIHVVGTNGKGSTCAMLSTVLQKAGYKVGLYTSPYIFRFHERMQVNGTPISDEDLTQITDFVRPFAEGMEDKPTEFELITCIALEYFRRQKTDIVVLEAGMGGALDSTNVIPAPEVAVICNIGLDHTEYLGNTLEEIARTKAGVVKAGSACVLYPSTEAVEATVREICEEKSVPLTVADFAKLTSLTNTLAGQTFHWEDLQAIRLPLLGEHQQHNACVVLETLMVLRQKGWNVPDSAIYAGLAETQWPGRFQLIGEDPLFIIDGGHNPQCMEALTRNLELYLKDTDLTVLTGVMADKDKDGMYPPLLPYVSRFVTVTPANPRSLPAEDLAQYLQTLGKDATACESVEEGVKEALRLAQEHHGAVLTCGSLYMLGEVVEAHRGQTP